MATCKGCKSEIASGSRWAVDLRTIDAWKSDVQTRGYFTTDIFGGLKGHPSCCQGLLRKARLDLVRYLMDGHPELDVEPDNSGNRETLKTSGVGRTCGLPDSCKTFHFNLAPLFAKLLDNPRVVDSLDFPQYVPPNEEQEHYGLTKKCPLVALLALTRQRLGNRTVPAGTLVVYDASRAKSLELFPRNRTKLPWLGLRIGYWPIKEETFSPSQRRSVFRERFRCLHGEKGDAALAYEERYMLGYYDSTAKREEFASPIRGKDSSVKSSTKRPLMESKKKWEGNTKVRRENNKRVVEVPPTPSKCSVSEQDEDLFEQMFCKNSIFSDLKEEKQYGGPSGKASASLSREPKPRDPSTRETELHCDREDELVGIADRFERLLDKYDFKQKTGSREKMASQTKGRERKENRVCKRKMQLEQPSSQDKRKKEEKKAPLSSVDTRDMGRLEGWQQPIRQGKASVHLVDKKSESDKRQLQGGGDLRMECQTEGKGKQSDWKDSVIADSESVQVPKEEESGDEDCILTEYVPSTVRRVDQTDSKGKSTPPEQPGTPWKRKKPEVNSVCGSSSENEAHSKLGGDGKKADNDFQKVENLIPLTSIDLKKGGAGRKEGHLQPSWEGKTAVQLVEVDKEAGSDGDRPTEVRTERKGKVSVQLVEMDEHADESYGKDKQSDWTEPTAGGSEREQLHREEKTGDDDCILVEYVPSAENRTARKEQVFNLTRESKERILAGRWLDADAVNLAQQILGETSSLAGFLPTTRVESSNISPLRGQFVQILFDRDRSHWVCVSTRNSPFLKIYDSLCNYKVSKCIARQIRAITGDRKVRPIFAKVQQQGNTSDCGVFAVAFATHAALGLGPEGVEFDIGAMRGHLLGCLLDRKMTPFPITESARQWGHS